MDIEIFAHRLKESRIAIRLTQEELAKKMNVSVKTISNWETAYSYPSLPVFIELANVLNLTTDYLLGRSDKQQLCLDDFTKKQFIAMIEIANIIRNESK